MTAPIRDRELDKILEHFGVGVHTAPPGHDESEMFNEAKQAIKRCEDAAYLRRWNDCVSDCPKKMNPAGLAELET